jgi:hypothetical protein
MAKAPATPQTDDLSAARASIEAAASQVVTRNAQSTSSVTDGPSPDDNLLELSIFEDGRDFGGAQTYGFELRIGGTTFYVVELSRDALRDLMAENRALEAETKRIQNLPADERLDASQALADRALSLSAVVVENCVKDWANPKWPEKVPCTTETKQALTRTIKTRVADEIVAKSISGRAASDSAADFLAR